MPSGSSASRCSECQRSAAPSRASIARSGRAALADEHRVARQHELAADDERAVLGPVAGRVPDDDLYRADADRLPVRERIERVLRPRERMDRDRHAVLEREAAVAREVVGVRVRLEHAHDPHAGLAPRVEVRLDRERRVDHDRLARLGVADEVRAAAEVVVDELPEEHAGKLARWVASAQRIYLLRRTPRGAGAATHRRGPARRRLHVPLGENA